MISISESILTATMVQFACSRSYVCFDSNSWYAITITQIDNIDYFVHHVIFCHYLLNFSTILSL